MSLMQCENRKYTITADVVEHPGRPTPWATGCHITNPDGQTTKRKTLSVELVFMSDLEKTQIAGVRSEVLVTGAYDSDDKVVLAGFDKTLPNGARLA